jgi:hypothetical protein
MLNTFDFIEIVAASPRKRDLSGARFPLETRLDGWQRYGSRSYPRYSYRVAAGYVDVAGHANLTEIVDAAIARAQEQFPNARITTHYHARD